MKISGVYQILNTKTGKMYIGSATNIFKRLKWHKYTLYKNKHHSILLQRAWNKYGDNCFIFNILEETNIDDLLKIEQLWLDASKCYIPKFGYNIYKIAGSPSGYKPTKEAIEKSASKNRGRKDSDKTKALKSYYQTNRTPEHRTNHSAAMKKRIFSVKHRLNLTLANLRRKPVSDETRKRMSEAQKLRCIKQGYVVKPKT